MKPVVAIVGRPNVGKSTLFNKLIGRRKAITKAEPGVTRDVNYADCKERGRVFSLIDTGGFEPAVTEGIMVQVREQARLAIEDADLIMLLLDGREGPTPDDIELVDILRKTDKDVIFVINKIDTNELHSGVAEFYSLGIESVFPVSAEHGRGLGELFDEILKFLPDAPKVDPDEVAGDQIKVAIVGRPNAGKSSLLNRLIGRERAIVSDVAGTTRDSIDTTFEKDGKEYLFIDTAGIRKKNRISRKLEIYCVMEAIKNIERSDVVLLVVDGHEGLRMQDEKIAGLIERSGRACIIVVNKWDLVEKDTHTTKLYTERIHDMMPFLSFAPIEFISALTGKRAKEVFEAVDRVMEAGVKKTSTSKLNKLLTGFVSRHHPAVYRGKEVKLYYVTQTGTAPQRFTVFVNHADGIQKAYRRYLINRFRESLDLTDVPVRVSFRSRR